MIHFFSYSGDRRAAGLSILQAVYHSHGEKERTPLALKTVLSCRKSGQGTVPSQRLIALQNGCFPQIARKASICYLIDWNSGDRKGRPYASRQDMQAYAKSVAG